MGDNIEFHFKGGDADTQMLPAEYMINLLSNVRELMYLLVSQKQGKTFNERFKASKEIKNNYIIKCTLPKKGSYAQALKFEYNGDPNLFNDNICDDVENTFTKVAENQEAEIIRLFPNNKMRSKALSCVRGALPQSDSDIYVEINNKVELNSKTIQKNTTAILDKTRNIIEEHMTVVTGRVAVIDFDKKNIVITHPITRKQLNCFYNEDIEDMLYENRRDLVQITGNVILDDNDNPKEITDVIDIQEVDLSIIELDVLIYTDKTLKFKYPFILTPELDETEQLYIIENSDLGIDLFAYTRAELLESLKEHILSLWEEYAQESDDNLTKDALILKNNLLKLIEEV